MKLLFKQRFSWLDSYDVYYENGQTAYSVRGQFALGHKLEVFDQAGYYVATLREIAFSFVNTFEIQVSGNVIGKVSRRWSFLKSKFDVDFLGWYVEGDFLGLDYTIYAPNGGIVARISKELFKFTDTYVVELSFPNDAINVLMVVLAIDAANCSN